MTFRRQNTKTNLPAYSIESFSRNIYMEEKEVMYTSPLTQTLRDLSDVNAPRPTNHTPTTLSPCEVLLTALAAMRDGVAGRMAAASYVKAP